MDEYSPKRHDIAQLKFLCETLIMTALQTLKKAIMAGLTTQPRLLNLQLNELIEHIATFALNYKIKYNEDNKLIEQIDEYLDDTFMLFSSYGINMQDLQKWRKSGNRLFRCFVNATKENPASLSC
ncbi:Hha toxicity modulator TomB [Escherichia coli]